jgi:hypothetical protein
LTATTPVQEIQKMNEELLSSIRNKKKLTSAMIGNDFNLEKTLNIRNFDDSPLKGKGKKIVDDVSSASGTLFSSTLGESVKTNPRRLSSIKESDAKDLLSSIEKDTMKRNSRRRG